MKHPVLKRFRQVMSKKELEAFNCDLTVVTSGFWLGFHYESSSFLTGLHHQAVMLQIKPAPELVMLQIRHQHA